MSIERLERFLMERSWETASTEEMNDLLASARQELEAGPNAANDHRIERLRELEAGSLSNADFERLVEDWRRLEREAEIARLKPELLAMASGFKDDEWETNLYWRISDAIVAFKEGDREELLTTAQSIRDLLTASWDAYLESSRAVEGTTAEAELGERVLEDSFTLFHSAVDELEDAANDEGTFGQALRCAETASRRMMAVQALNQKVIQRAEGG